MPDGPATPGNSGLKRTLGTFQGAEQGRRPPRHRRAVPRPADYSGDTPSHERAEYAAGINCVPMAPDRQTPARRWRGLNPSTKVRFRPTPPNRMFQPDPATPAVAGGSGQGRVAVDILIQQIAKRRRAARIAGLRAKSAQPHEITRFHLDPLLIEVVDSLSL